MAVPNINYNMTLIEELQQGTNAFVAPTLDSANTPNSFVNYQGGEGWFQTTNVTGLYGGRCVLLSGGSDFSGNPYIFFQLASQSFNGWRFLDTLANGGLRILFEDSLGNWVRYNIHGGDIYDTTEFSVFRRVGQTGAGGGYLWIIDRDRTPDASSGAIDWTDIVALETHASQAGGSENPDVIIGRLNVCDNAIITAGEVADPANFQVLSDGRDAIPNNGDSDKWFFESPNDFQGGLGTAYMSVYGVQIGDGSTTTYWEQSAGQLAIYPSRDAIENGDNTKPVYGAPFLGDSVAGYGRQVIINQSATDTVLFNAGFIFSGVQSTQGGEYDLIVQGNTSGTCTFTSNQFYNANKVELAHATATDCQFQNVSELLITSDTVITGSSYTNAIGSNNGVVVDDVAGDYSGVDIRFNNNNQYDISLGAGGAGTYDFSGISVTSGYTLKIRNNSATNAVTIILPAGITTSTSTAGGSITVNGPSTTYTLQLPNIVNSSRFQIYNITTSTELTNSTTSGGAGINETYTAGTDYTAGDTGRYRITQQNGTNASEPIEGTFTFAAATTINSIPINQTSDTVYAAYGLNGSTISKFAADYADDEVDLIVGSNFSGKEFYSWWVYNLTTEQGIREFFGGVDAIDNGNLKMDNDIVDIFWDNDTASNVYQTDTVRIFRKDEAYPVKDPTTGGGGIDIVWKLPVLVISTGGSALTAAENEKLMSLNTDNLDVAVSTRLAASSYTTPDNASIAAILSDTDELQTNQNDWVTATGFATSLDITDNALTAVEIRTEIDDNSAQLETILNTVNLSVALSA